MSNTYLKVVLFLILVSNATEQSSEAIRSNPPYYAINLGGEAGQRILPAILHLRLTDNLLIHGCVTEREREREREIP